MWVDGCFLFSFFRYFSEKSENRIDKNSSIDKCGLVDYNASHTSLI